MHSAMLHSESEGGIRRTDQYLYGRRFSTRLQCDRGEDRRDKEGAGGRCV